MNKETWDHSTQSSHYSYTSQDTEEEPSDTPLTPWELWLVKKAEEERKRIQEARKKKLIEAKERKETARARLSLQVKAQEAFLEWKQSKDEAERRKKQTEREEMKQRRIASTETVSLLQQKQKEGFSRWCTKKKEEKLKKTQLGEAMKRLTIEKEVERKLQAEEVYEQWLSEVETRHIKRGYSVCTEIKPTFCNPNPWVGPCDNNNTDEMHVTKKASRKAARKGVPLGKQKQPSKKQSKKFKQPLSPPLLFKCRRDKANHIAWGRQR